MNYFLYPGLYPGPKAGGSFTQKINRVLSGITGILNGPEIEGGLKSYEVKAGGISGVVGSVGYNTNTVTLPTSKENFYLTGVIGIMSVDAIIEEV